MVHLWKVADRGHPCKSESTLETVQLFIEFLFVLFAGTLIVKFAPLARVWPEGRVPADWRPNTGSPWEKKARKWLFDGGQRKGGSKEANSGGHDELWGILLLNYKAPRVTGTLHKGNKRLYTFLLSQFVKKLKKYSVESNHVLFLSFKMNLYSSEKEGWRERQHCKELLHTCWLDEGFLWHLMEDEYLGGYMRYCFVNFPGSHKQTSVNLRYDMDNKTELIQPNVWLMLGLLTKRLYHQKVLLQHGWEPFHRWISNFS